MARNLPMSVVPKDEGAPGACSSSKQGIWVLLSPAIALIAFAFYVVVFPRPHFGSLIKPEMLFDQFDKGLASGAFGMSEPDRVTNEHWQNPRTGEIVTFTVHQQVQAQQGENSGTVCRRWAYQSAGPNGAQSWPGVSCAGPDGIFRFP